MRELFPVDAESTDEMLVLASDDGERFRVPRAVVASRVAPDTSAADGSEGLGQPEQDTAPQEASDETLDGSETPEFHRLAENAPEVERSLPQPDPLYATPLSLRPSEIQARIRAGASAQELADEMGVAVSRLDAYSHPVLLERDQVAEAAKQSHPVREDGPAKLTLFEILATAFAARGHSLTDATWDAVREPGDDWVVRVNWRAGLSENRAEWSFKRSGLSATTEARNAIAADLTDPNFLQPVRSLTAVGQPDDQFDRDVSASQQEAGTRDDDTSPDDRGPDTREDVFEGEFLKHPEPTQAPQRRKRKAVTPHWEDVLLGVRTNTKRPRK
ncbi:septation protein SepH [Corynebacterium cystitidis]|uniref:septation protein SepH n=1 Tax=Corynebacterium cystitidis TaxID=35757 RepID=UPI00211EA439|nr:septation protein SepH [Corynebacterium cystitidis]